jgi:hypothetical protein
MKENRTSTRPWVIGFGLVAAALGVFLLMADRPDDVAREVAKRVAAGKKAPAESDFAIGLWWAALGNLVAVLGLMACSRLWARRLPDAGRGFEPCRCGRGFWIALLAVMALGGVMRWNLAHGSLWWDELWPAKFAVVGYYIGEPETPLEERKFAEGSWQRALWHYTRPTNHPAASFPARLSHVVWQKFARPESPHAFSDFAVRFPNWLASLAAIGLVGVVGALWRAPLGGILAALVLAVHPWHIRYGIDLRGYSWMILWTVAGLVWLTLMLRSGRSRWWAWWGFGVNQALLVWSFPHAAAVAAAFFGVAFFLIFRLWRERADRWSALLRLILVNGVAAMLFVQLFAPNALQMSRWLDEVNANHQGHGLDGPKLLDFVGWWFAGTTWRLPTMAESEGLADLVTRAAAPVMGAALVAIAGLLGVGLLTLARRGSPAIWLALAPLAAGGVLLGVFGATDSFFYPRFLTFLLVPFALLAGLACDWQWAGARSRVIVAGLALGGMAWLMAPQWEVLMSRPYAPMRDVAEVFAAEKQPAIVACYGHGGEMLPGYAPEVRHPASLAELKALAEEARSRGMGLVVAFGFSAFNRAEVPDGFEWLDDPGRFEQIATRRGIEPEFYFRILRWTGRG